MKAMLALQVFLLRRNWMGSMGEYIMALTTTGRTSGRRISTPIGYLRDGDTIFAINPYGRSNWFKNMLANPAVELAIQGQTCKAYGELISDPAEIARVFELYRQWQPAVFPRLFGITADAPQDQRIEARDSRKFVRFSLVNDRFASKPAPDSA